jgi:hypothetical protein
MLLVAVLPESVVTVPILLGRGEPGTFTAEQETCHRNRYGRACQWRGRFDGDDGIARRPVYLEGDPSGWHPGTTARLIWLPHRPGSVFYPGDLRPLLLVSACSWRR